jgi:hypothetical protein
MRAFMPLKMTMTLWYESSGRWRVRSCNNCCNMVVLTRCSVGHILEICWHKEHQFGCIVSIRCGGFCGSEEWVFEGKHTKNATVVFVLEFSGKQWSWSCTWETGLNSRWRYDSDGTATHGTITAVSCCTSTRRAWSVLCYIYRLISLHSILLGFMCLIHFGDNNWGGEPVYVGKD